MMQVPPTQPSTPPHSLALALHEPTDADTRDAIVSRLWASRTSISSPPALAVNLDWHAYFAYYTREGRTSLVDQGMHNAARTHRDVLWIASSLKSLLSRETTRENARSRLLTQSRSPESEGNMVEGCIKLVVRLLTMVNIGALPSELSGKMCLDWSKGSLQDCIHGHFNAVSQADFEDTIIGSDLTARYIDRVARIEVVPTDNLLDHLRLVDNDCKLCVFHHISFLRYMKAIERQVLSLSSDELLH